MKSREGALVFVSMINFAVADWCILGETGESPEWRFLIAVLDSIQNNTDWISRLLHNSPRRDAHTNDRTASIAMWNENVTFTIEKCLEKKKEKCEERERERGGTEEEKKNWSANILPVHVASRALGYIWGQI